MKKKLNHKKVVYLKFLALRERKWLRIGVLQAETVYPEAKYMRSQNQLCT